MPEAGEEGMGPAHIAIVENTFRFERGFGPSLRKPSGGRGSRFASAYNALTASRIVQPEMAVCLHSPRPSTAARLVPMGTYF